MLVVREWCEVYVVQRAVLEGLLYPLVTEAVERAGTAHNGAPVSMLTSFLGDWYADNCRWVDAVLKAAAAESEDNRAVLNGWLDHWGARAAEALAPLATDVLSDMGPRSEEHTSELQSLLRISYAVFCLKKKTTEERATPE